MPRTSIQAGALAVLLAISTCVRADAFPDDARESRWAAEVVPQVVVGDPVWLATPHRARVLALWTLPAGPPKGAVIVVHGLGVHPDWELVGALRSGLADRGFATLSVQMPVLASDARREHYAGLYPLAAERLDAALAWLRTQGQRRVAVVSHSLGAAMTDAWLARVPPPAVDAWVPIGMMAPFAVRPRMPVLDVVAERDFPEVVRSAPARAAAIADRPCSDSVSIAATDHFLAGAVPRALDRIAPFLERALTDACRP